MFRTLLQKKKEFQNVLSTTCFRVVFTSSMWLNEGKCDFLILANDMLFQRCILVGEFVQHLVEAVK